MISIIVPVYNIDKFLRKCVDSLLRQTYQDIEILLIDDGSTDSSSDICDELEEKYPEVVHVIHTKNGGLSAARNIGIKYARGEYIGFVDGDDWVEPEMFETLIHNMEQSGCNLSICSLKPDFSEHGEEMNKVNTSRMLGKEELMEALLTDYSVLGYACNKLFRSEYAEKTLFDETLYSSEDIDFCVRYAEFVDYAIATDSQLYHYRQRIGSMTSDFSYSFRKLSVIKAYENILPIYKSSYPLLACIVERYLVKQYLNVLGRMEISKIDNPYLRDQLKSKVRGLLYKVMSEKRNSLFTKVNIILTRMAPGYLLRLKQWIIKRQFKI